MKSNYLIAALATALVVCSSSLTMAQWLLTGNAGTTPGTNFIGTTDTAHLIFKTNSASGSGERMRITSSGFIGMGVTTPGSKLHVKDNTSASTSGYGPFTISSGTGTTNEMRFDGNHIQTVSKAVNGTIASSLAINMNGGSIAIGTSSTSARLNVGADTGERALQVAINGSTKLMIESNGGTALGYGSSNTPPSNGLIVKGKTGIGKVNPTAMLHVTADANERALQVAINGSTKLMVESNGGVAMGYGSSNTPPGDGLIVNGNVGIGTASPNYKLDVCGTIRAKEVRVETGWCDFVFEKNYPLPSLSALEDFIKTHKHLPDVTPGLIIESEGLEVGKAASQMIRKIEELTLYVIALQKQVDDLKKPSK